MRLTEHKIQEIDRITNEIYNKYHPTGFDIDDMKQECYVGILACQNPHKSVIDIVIPICRNLILKSGYAATLDCDRTTFYNLTDVEIENYVGERLCNLKNVEGSFDIDKYIDESYMLEKAFSKLTERERLVLKLRFWNNFTYEERARQIEFKALRKLRHPAIFGIEYWLRDNERTTRIIIDSSSSHIFTIE